MKKALSLLFILLILLAGCKNNKPKKYQWFNSYHGGGGYVTGILQHPVNPEIIYIRTDVAGMFKSYNGGKSWVAINNGLTEGHHHCVETFALSIQNPDILYRASGEGRNHQMVGAIHKSIDGGNTWKLVTNKPDFFGNGATRFYGEKIVVNPSNSKLVVAASNYKGIWLSADEGETWNCTGLAGEPFGCIAFDTKNKTRIYAGTLDSLPFANYLTNGLYKREKKGKLYISEDNGKTWRIIYEKNNTSFTNIIVDKDQENILFATFQNDGIYKSIDGGKTFIKKTTSLRNVDFSTICADPNSNSVYYAAICRYPGQSSPIMPLFKSIDKGETWKLIKDEYKWSDFKNFPLQYDRPEVIGWAISKFIVDNKNPSKFYLSDWFGLATSNDTCNTWNGNSFRGIENICLESIIADPNDASKVYFTGADGQPCISLDSGKTYESFPYLNSKQNYYCSTALCPSIFKNGTIVYGVTNSALRLSALCRTDDYGKHCEFSKHLTKGLFVQAIKEDYFEKGVFYAYLDGALKDSAGLYKSADWGKTWMKMNLQLPSEIKTLPFRKEFIESELLSVTAYQVKNVCGANQLLCVDPTKPNTLYFGEADKGIFATFDGCKTWENIGKNLPFGKDIASILNAIKADSKNPGWLYAGFIREGLWRTKDYGKTWQKIFPLEQRVFNATSVALEGTTGREIYVACEPLFWSKAESAVYASYNNGETWSNIYDSTLGSIRWKGIDIDNKTGILYAVSCGNGSFYAKRTEN